MSSNSVQIIHQLHRDFQELVEYVTGEESQSRTAYEVELTLFRVPLLVLNTKGAQRLARKPLGRLCSIRFPLYNGSPKSIPAKTPGRRPGRLHARVGR